MDTARTLLTAEFAPGLDPNSVRRLKINSSQPVMLMSKSEQLQSRWHLMSGLLASLVLTACSSTPPKPVETPDQPAVSTRDEADVQRIDELERQLAEQQRQLTERQRQLTERRRLYFEEKQRLERSLKESQSRSDELQNKLDAILAIDRDLRRGSKSPE